MSAEPGPSPHDEELVTQLRRLAARVDPVPPHVTAAARAAITWRDPDAALARLVAEHADPATAGARGGARLLTFATASLTVEVETTLAGAAVDLVGQLVPTGPADVAVRHRGGEATTTADRLGRFMVRGLPRGPLRVVVRLAADPAVPVHTEAFLA